MENKNLFEIAVRNKFRFPFRGLVSVEDLFDLTVESLDSVYKELNSQLKTIKEESLLNTKSKEDKELDAKIEIVKYIFDVKVAEKEFKQKEKERKLQRQKVLEILANKQEESLQNKSEEELKAMLNDLND